MRLKTFRWLKSRNPIAAGALLFGVIPASAYVLEATVHQARVKDIASIEGIRDNQLVGYGIVVGLAERATASRPGFPYRRCRLPCCGWE